MARILVTGGCGFIGSHLVEALMKLRQLVVVVDNLSTGRRSNLPSRCRLIKADIRSERLMDIFRQVRPEYVFHLAAQKSVFRSIVEPVVDADTNILGSLQVLEAARRFRIKRIIFASTGGAIYGPTSRLRTPESTSPQPTSPYGLAKWTIEQYLTLFTELYRLPSVALRLANVYGPRQDPIGEAGVIAIFLRRLKLRQPLIIHGTGRQTCDFLFVGDAVRAFLTAWRRHASGVLNVGTGRQTSILRLVRQLQRLSGWRLSPRHRAAIPGEVVRSALHIGRLQRTLGWSPRVLLSEGLRQTWQWEMANA
ncbi:MAG: NAD-dependent epimerase/dehydratase family protein [Candidatus Kerfeldbacteria bacterium]|nr:NAD-dependent epimerase/dehydratase family protein [Candidatus Kerfeldbacteria bacterium]